MGSTDCECPEGKIFNGEYCSNDITCEAGEYLSCTDKYVKDTIGVDGKYLHANKKSKYIIFKYKFDATTWGGSVKGNTNQKIQFTIEGFIIRNLQSVCMIYKQKVNV